MVNFPFILMTVGNFIGFFLFLLFRCKRKKNTFVRGVKREKEKKKQY